MNTTQDVSATCYTISFSTAQFRSIPTVVVARGSVLSTKESSLLSQHSSVSVVLRGEAVVRVDEVQRLVVAELSLQLLLGAVLQRVGVHQIGRASCRARA